MVDERQTIKYDLFPTHVVRSKCPSITLEDKQEMLESVDLLIENGCYSNHELVPMYQTHVVLFQKEAPPIWQKLKKEFINACDNYLHVVDNFTKNQKQIEYTDFGAWAYKGWESLNKGESNPWHDHNPSFLSGVYYLHDPGDGTCGGTEFHDPRTPPAIGTQMQEVIPMENTWIIFPGWFCHRSRQLPLEEPRVVIAANAYAKLNHYW